MKNTFNLKIIISLVALVLFAYTSTAHAYLDPGSGSAILQGVLGAIAAVIVLGKLYWYRILRLFGLSKKTSLKKDAIAIEQERNNKS